jgi:hypothetical protein
VDWRSWHDQYDDPDSPLGQRLRMVQRLAREALDRSPPGPITLISVCAGQGRDVAGALAAHSRAADVRARLVERDERNVAKAREAGLDSVCGDASLTDAYLGAVPAEVVLICGVFGNVADADVRRAISYLPQLCAPGATVLWTRHRVEPDLTPAVRRWLAEESFEELAFECDDSGVCAVGAARFAGRPRALTPGARMFEFVDGLGPSGRAVPSP